MNAPLIVENPKNHMLYCFAQYRYYFVNIEHDELDGMLGILQIWITDDDCRTFLIDPDQCTPRCKTPDKFWEVLMGMGSRNRFIVHGEP